MNFKKGQAALEFLTTYGWAFLVILIMISALAYFGVLTPSNFLPERCNVASEFQCSDFRVSEGTTAGMHLNLELALTNNVGTGITIQDLVIALGPGVSLAFDCGVAATPIAAGQTQTLTCTDIVGTFPSVGEKQKLGFDINYTKVGGNFPHVVSGEVFATIQ